MFVDFLTSCNQYGYHHTTNRACTHIRRNLIKRKFQEHPNWTTQFNYTSVYIVVTQYSIKDMFFILFLNVTGTMY